MKSIQEQLADIPCPYAKDIFTMTVAEYVRVLPDPKTRTAVSGLLMRLGWEECMRQVKEKINAEK